MTLHKNVKRSALSLACLSSMASLNAYADGILSGRVTDSQNKVYFEGALIKINELNLKQVSKEDGSFYFSSVPSGSYTLQIKYLGADVVEYPINIQDDMTTTQDYKIGRQSGLIENVLVVGQRAGEGQALNKQRNSKNLKSVVSSDSIGQFPDQNAAEALQRLPGVFIQRDQGEGRFVGIRGLDPNLNNLTINGSNIPSPESGVRSVAMDVIPSELIEGLEVSKTVTPDMDADAIGGSIEIKSLTAFDRENNSFTLTAQTSYNDQTEENSPKLSGSYTHIQKLSNGHQIGVATALSWYERDFGSHNIETDGGWGNIDVEDQATGEDIEGFGAEEIEQRHYLITRERTGFAVNLDYHVNPTNKYFLRTLRSQFSDDEYRLRNEYKFEDGQVNADTWTPSNGEFTNAEVDRDTKDRFEEQTITSIVAGGENKVDRWHFEYSAAYSQSREEEPNRIDVDFTGDVGAIGYASSGPVPRLTQSADAQAPSNFELDEITFEDNTTEDEELSFRIDIARDFSLGKNEGQIKFGAKHRAREKFNDARVVVYDGGFNDATIENFTTTSPDWSLGSFGPGISRNGISSFVLANRVNFDINASDSTVDSAVQSFRSEEDITAAYAMVDLNIDKWNIIAGFRFESTDFYTIGNRVELIEDAPPNLSILEVNKSYHHFLPSVNVRYDFNDQVVTRFAYTNTISRPSFGDSAAFLRIEEDEAEAGNPNLEPFEASNIDLSIEYYPGGIGVLSAGFFHKEIDNFIVQAEVQDNGQWEGFDEVIQSINGGSADISGVELAFTKTFDLGILISANATFTDADDKLPNQADSIGNLVLGYENDKFSARLTLTHKDKSFQFADGEADVFQDQHQQIDLSLKYQITDNFKVFLNGINLNDEPFYLYHGQSRFNYQYETYGSTYELGLRFSSF